MTEQRIVYIVEDDTKIAQLVADYLADAGHRTRIFPDGRAVVDALMAEPPAALILDMMLPAGDGLSLCKQVRTFSSVPILVLTARVDELDKLEALGRGADDYVTKPFSPHEVVARVNAMIRRAEGRTLTGPVNQAYFVDDDGLRIAWRGQWLDLSPSEFRLMAMLVRQPGRVFTRDQLLDGLGESASESTDRAIDSHVKNIRRKIGKIDLDNKCIASVYGSGYRFNPVSGALK